MRHLACMRAALVAAIVGFLFVQGVSWAQETPETVSLVLPAEAVTFLETMKVLGLPGVMAWLGWYGKGVVQKGVVINVVLSDATIVKLARAIRGEPLRDDEVTDPGGPRP